MRHSLLLIVLGGLVFIAGFSSFSMHEKQLSIDLPCGFTSHFTKYLEDHGFSQYSFGRPDLKCGAYGGKENQKEEIKKFPVVFIHGNSDLGFGRGAQDGYKDWQTGFRALANYLTINHGYSSQELFTTTWGPANLEKAMNQYHSKEYLTSLRAFVQAVIDYTKASKINIVSHSMGVTLARKIIKGGISEDHSYGKFDLGVSLKSKVHAFIGIAGGNLGLANCYGASTLTACNIKDGFFPGATSVSSPSEYLAQLNNNGGTEGDNVYSVWSRYDEVLEYQCVVWGKVTCRIPSQTNEIEKTTKQWTHIKLRDDIGPDIIDLL